MYSFKLARQKLKQGQMSILLIRDPGPEGPWMPAKSCRKLKLYGSGRLPTSATLSCPHNFKVFIAFRVDVVEFHRHF